MYFVSKVGMQTQSRDKLKVHEALEDKIPGNLSCSACIWNLLFSYEFLQNDFASQLLP
jgi:hypothetical protein